VRSKKRS
jgi:ribosomal protein L12E/L44/L45/RPP1/RPP2